MWPDRVSNLGPLALEADALPTALRGPARPGSLFITVHSRRMKVVTEVRK